MQFNEAFLIAFVAGFIRTTAMLMSSPLAGNLVPVTVRVFLGMAVSLSLSPVILPYVTPLPTHFLDLVALGIREALVGVTIGMFIQFLVGAIQMAGSILDMQVGIGSAQIMNPGSGGMSTPIGTFKFWLAIVLLLLLNAHHMMFTALVKSYSMVGIIGGDMNTIMESVVTTFGRMMMVCIQIAAPVIGVTVVIDVAAGLINKAVPQTQPFLLSLPAKLALGMMTLSLGLPGLVVIVQRAVDVSFDGLSRVLGG